MTILYLRIAFVSVLFLASHHTAIACEYRAEVSVSHQRSADVISALRDATIAGVLPTNSAQPKNGELLDNGSTIERMQRFGNALASSGAKAASGLSMLLVEDGLWSRYRAMQEGVAFQIQARGAQADDTVVITGEAVLAAIEEGTLSSDEAIARGLIVIVPGGSIDDGKILSAFASFAKADNFGQPIAFKKQQPKLR
jgi:hypothetical protein